MTEGRGPAAIAARVRDREWAPLVTVVGFALLVGTYAAWLGGDYGLGLGSLVGFGLVAAYVLVQQPTTRAVAARGCYLLAVLVLATPVFLNLPVLTGRHSGIPDPTALVFHPGVYVMALVFVGLAVLLGAAGLLLDDT